MYVSSIFSRPRLSEAFAAVACRAAQEGRGWKVGTRAARATRPSVRSRDRAGFGIIPPFLTTSSIMRWYHSLNETLVVGVDSHHEHINTVAAVVQIIDNAAVAPPRTLCFFGLRRLGPGLTSGLGKHVPSYVELSRRPASGFPHGRCGVHNTWLSRAVASGSGPGRH